MITSACQTMTLVSSQSLMVYSTAMFHLEPTLGYVGWISLSEYVRR